MVRFLIIGLWISLQFCSSKPSSISKSSFTNEDYKKALENGLRTIPAVHDFQEIFPKTLNSYTYWTGELGPTTLNSSTALYNRYELTLQVKASLDKTRTKVIGYGEPEFFLLELGDITFRPDGTTSISPGDLQKRFGPKEWNKLYEAGGDFSVLGIELVKDKPVPNFEEYWKERAEREKR